MKIKITCREENYEKFKNFFEEHGFVLSDEEEYQFIEVDFQRHQIICLDFKGNRIFTDLNEICLIEADTYKNRAILKDGSELLINENLSYFENRDYNSIFARINKSQVVNLSEIKRISPQINSRYKLTLKNNNIVYVSRTYIKKFRNTINVGGK